MHLKILFGVLTLGLASASPKAVAKPAAKASLQDFSNGQTFYVPSNSFGQNYGPQSFPGQPSLGYYNVRYSPSNYGQSYGNPIGVPVYQQASSGNYYQQQPQLISVPVAYSSSAGNGYNGGGRLWPKNLVSPTGSPSPLLSTSPPLFYPSSTSSSVAYQSTGNYVNSPLTRNLQIPGSTLSPTQAPYEQLIPVPVKVGLRNSFQPEVTNYNTASQNTLVTPKPYFPNYQQQSTSTPYQQQSYQQPTGVQYAVYQPQATADPYVARYEQPTAAPYQVNYYQQQPTPVSYQPNYKQQSYSYQQPTVSPFVSYQQQQTASPYVAQYQPSAGVYYSANYQQPTASSFPANYQRIPVPVGYPHNQVQFQTTKPTSTYSVTSTSSYPSIPVKSQSISILPTSPTPDETVTITEKSYDPVLTTPTASKATIIKSEYNSGSVSPQYNLVPSYSTTSPFAYTANQYLPQPADKLTYGVSYSPSKSMNGYSPSTDVSQVSYNSLGTNYSYKK